MNNKIIADFKRSFDENELEFKIGATNSDKTMGLALPYVQARAIQNRLDSTIGFDNWKVSYKEISNGFLCQLSIKINNEWITKEDGAPLTEFESIKGGISNSFKRVASSGFGIGRYLYNIKTNWYPIKKQGKSYIFISHPKLDYNNSTIKKIENKNTSKKESVLITFGKYQGLTIKDIYKKDKKYIQYLIDKARDTKIVEECKLLSA